MSLVLSKKFRKRETPETISIRGWNSAVIIKKKKKKKKERVVIVFEARKEDDDEKEEEEDYCIWSKATHPAA